MIPDLDMITLCAPNVAPETIIQIIKVKSNGDPFSIHVNGVTTQHKRTNNREMAINLAKKALYEGYSVDIGLMQVNSKNAKAMGYSIESLLDPCTNLKAGSSLLREQYARAIKVKKNSKDALFAALSAYNTGNFQDGVKNGYVFKYYSKTTRRSMTTDKAKLANNSFYSEETTIFKRRKNNEQDR